MTGTRYYKFPFPDKDACDLATLKQKMASAGVNVLDINLGNGALILQTPDDLTATQKTAIDAIVSTHAPMNFTWMEGGRQRKAMVRTREDVDRITAMRIRSLHGDDDPIQAQIKVLTVLLFKLYKNIVTSASLASLKAQAKADVLPYIKFRDRRAAVIAEGRDFKVANML